MTPLNKIAITRDSSALLEQINRHKDKTLISLDELATLQSALPMTELPAKLIIDYKVEEIQEQLGNVYVK